MSLWMCQYARAKKVLMSAKSVMSARLRHYLVGMTDFSTRIVRFPGGQLQRVRLAWCKLVGNSSLLILTGLQLVLIKRVAIISIA